MSYIYTIGIDEGPLVLLPLKVDQMNQCLNALPDTYLYSSLHFEGAVTIFNKPWKVQKNVFVSMKDTKPGFCQNEK